MQGKEWRGSCCANRLCQAWGEGGGETAFSSCLQFCALTTPDVVRAKQCSCTDWHSTIRRHRWIEMFSLSLFLYSQPGKQKKKFSSFFKSLVIELDKELYGPDNHLVEVWHHFKGIWCNIVDARNPKSSEAAVGPPAWEHFSQPWSDREVQLESFKLLEPILGEAGRYPTMFHPTHCDLCLKSSHREG